MHDCPIYESVETLAASIGNVVSEWCGRYRRYSAAGEGEIGCLAGFPNVEWWGRFFSSAWSREGIVLCDLASRRQCWQCVVTEEWGSFIGLIIQPMILRGTFLVVSLGVQGRFH